MSSYGERPAVVPAEYTAAVMRSAETLVCIKGSNASNLLQPRGEFSATNLVTVIIPMLNASGFVETCLKGLLAQTYTNFELFCVDDNSTDDTYARVVGQFGTDYRVCAIRLARTVGPYQIKNWVLTCLARGSFIAMQDADDVSHPSRFTRQIQMLASNAWNVCGTSVHQFFKADTPPLFGGMRVKVFDKCGWQHSLAAYETVETCRTPVTFAEILGETRRDYIAMHGSQMFRKSLLLEMGGFDGRTRLGADTDLNWRILRSEPIGNLPDVLYSRRYHPLSLTRHPMTGVGSPLRARYVERRDREHEVIRIALENGEFERCRALCTQDFFCDDVVVRELHSQFDVTL
jgi:glycosyltransferase involved in cell wall biosynthesis